MPETEKTFEGWLKRLKRVVLNRALRSNLYGHLSFNIIQDPQLNKLPDVTVEQVDEALKSVQAVITFLRLMCMTKIIALTSAK